MVLSENLISKQVEEYITYKRSLGFKITVEADELKRFADYTKSIGYEGSLTSELAMSWATLKSDYSRFYMARRLENIHTFAKYIVAFDPDAQLPRLGVFGKSHIRISPYIYSTEDICLLMAETKKLFSPDGIRAYTVSTAIGLLRATGLRVSELTSLKNEDAHLDEGYLFINSSKFKKDRIVPLHKTALKELSEYRAFITTQLGHRSETDYFFVSSYGHRFNTRSFEYAFRLIRPVLNANCTRDNARNLRLYDVRHTFACETVRHWLESGVDVNHKLYLLSTYMGHTKPTDTYWYLSATPELLAISCSRYEMTFDNTAARNAGEGLTE
jgi:site-specific recombinase XerD